MPYGKKVVDVSVPHRSGANMSHRNSGTLTCGTLTPLLVEEIIPGTKCHLKIPEVVQLPPLVSDTYMNVKLKHEAFFVPFRILSASFEDWFNDYPKLIANYATAGYSASLEQINAKLPVFEFDDSVSSSVFGAGTLLDYLGCKIDSISSGGSFQFSPLSLIAYHLIWQEYYRNPRVQAPAFAPDLGGQVITAGSNHIPGMRVASMPYHFYHGAFTNYGQTFADDTVIQFDSSNLNGLSKLADTTSIFSLRQRNFGLDYFTSARPSPQQGNASSVTMSLDTGTNTSTFTIAQLRAANSLQQFRERNNLPSPRMVDQVKARYGVNLSDGVAQRPIFIGSSTFDIVTRGVDQQGDVTSGANPFNSVASQYGRAYAVGDGVLIDNFEAHEPGFIMVLQSIVPEVTYSTGVAAYLSRYIADGSLVEMANPLLQNIGDEPINDIMLYNDPGQAGSVFAYQDRYGSFMYHPNESHGMFRDSQSLASFVLQRGFNSAPTYGTSFLEIPTTYLDDVFAASSGVTGVAAWYDAKLEWKISHPLNEFSIPSLQDPAYEHGNRVSLVRNGQIF